MSLYRLGCSGDCDLNNRTACLRMAASPPMASILFVKISLAVGSGPVGCGVSGVMMKLGVGAAV